MKNFITILLLLVITIAQAQLIEDLTLEEIIAIQDQEEARMQEDYQIQIDYNRQGFKLLNAKVQELKLLITKLHKVNPKIEKSQNLIKFENFLNSGKDYLYIYKKFNKNDLKAIAIEVEASTSGIKKTIALAIQNKLK